MDAQAIRALYLREKRLEQELAYLKNKLKSIGINMDSSSEDEEEQPKKQFNTLRKKKKSKQNEHFTTHTNTHTKVDTNTQPSEKRTDCEDTKHMSDQELECFKILFENSNPIVLIDGGGI